MARAVGGRKKKGNSLVLADKRARAAIIAVSSSVRECGSGDAVERWIGGPRAPFLSRNYKLIGIQIYTMTVLHVNVLYRCIRKHLYISSSGKMLLRAEKITQELYFRFILKGADSVYNI